MLYLWNKSLVPSPLRLWSHPSTFCLYILMRRWVHGASVMLWQFGCTRHIFGAQQSWSCVKMSFLSHTEWCSKERPPPALVISHLPVDTWVAATSWRRWKCSREHGWVEIPPFFPDFYQFDIFRSGISVSYNNPILNFCLISTEFYIPTNRAQGFQFLHILLCYSAALKPHHNDMGC